MSAVIDLTMSDDDEIKFVARNSPPRTWSQPHAKAPSRIASSKGPTVREWIEIGDDDDDDTAATSSSRNSIRGSTGIRPNKRPRLEESRATPLQASSSKRALSSISSSRLPQSLPNTPPPPRPRPALPPRSPEERYFHDIFDEQRWKSPASGKRPRLEESDNEGEPMDEDQDGLEGEDRSLTPPKEPSAQKRPRPPVMPPWARLRPVCQLEDGISTWLRSLRVKRTSDRSWGARMLKSKPTFKEDLGFDRLNITAEFNNCPGSILRIAQSRGNIIFGGACEGGGNNADGDHPPTEPGSLQIWNQRTGQTLLGFAHRDQEAPNGVPRWKYYAINDVKFVPGSSAFLASGYDHQVRVLKEIDGQCYESASFELQSFAGIPHDIAFKPESTIFAVGEADLHIFFDISVADDQFEPTFDVKKVASNTRVSLAPPNHGGPLRHAIGAFRWGFGSTADQLFASTEPVPTEGQNEASCVGYHKVINPKTRHQRAILYELDAKEAGDAMALSPTGDILALSTNGAGNSSILRLYDIRNKNGKAKVRIDLEPYEDNAEAEVHDMNFSSDGILLSLARQDNSIYVYDSRFLTKGPLYRYKHQTKVLRTDGRPCPGVMKAEWIESSRFSSSRLGLLTGGGDGCVRLWDPLVAADDDFNGTPVVEMDQDVATFSLGDRLEGEHHLVVGGGTGGVVIYDRLHLTTEDLEWM